MVYQHNFSQSDIGYAGVKLKTCVYTGAALQAISRSAISDLPHVGSGQDHPTLAGVIRDSETLFPLSGEISCVYTWDAADDTQVAASISDWRALVERADTTVTVDQSARQATVVINGDYNHNDWVSHPTKWILKSPNAAATASRASKILCIERLVDENDWTLEYLCVPASGTKQITKEGTDCYLFVSGAATIGSTSIDAGETVAMNSPTATITATDRCVVIRVYK
jgi:hypothetical protein